MFTSFELRGLLMTHLKWDNMLDNKYKSEILQSVCCPRLSGASKGILCAAYFGQYFRISRIIDYYLNLIYINYFLFWMFCF